MGANVLVEFEKKILTGGIFFLNRGQKIILGSRKSAFLGIILTPDLKVLLGVGHLLHVLGIQIYYPLSQGRIHEFTRGKGFVYPFLMQYT